MANALKLALPLLLSLPAVAQQQTPSDIYCNSAIPIYVYNGDAYTCKSGTPNKLASSSSAGVSSITGDASGIISNAASTGAVTLTLGNTPTGSGGIVLATSPTLVTPALGTPSALVITNATGTCTSCNVGGTAANLSGSQTANTVYAAPNGSSGTASFRALVAADLPSQSYYDNAPAATTATAVTTTITQNTIQEMPVYISFSLTVSSIGYQVTTADNTANVYDIGLYGPGCKNGATNVPLAAHTGSVAGTTLTPSTGPKDIALTATESLQPGWYCWAVTSSAASPAAIFGGPSVTGHPVPFARQAAVAGGGATLPSTITAPALSVNTSTTLIALQLYTF